jgi:hypothetical protein
MAEKKSGTIILYKHMKIFDDAGLSMAEIGELLSAAIRYDESGTTPEFDSPVLKALFAMMKYDLDAMRESWDSRTKARSDAGKAGTSKRWHDVTAAITSDNKNNDVTVAITSDNKNNNVIAAITGDNKNNYSDSESDSVSDSGIPMGSLLCASEEPPPLPAKRSSSRASQFETFWAAYPKKVGKQDARQVWERLKPDNEFFAKIIAAVEAATQSRQWQQEGGRFIPNPATWLRQGRWDDEPPKSYREELMESRDVDGWYDDARRAFENAATDF